MSKSTSQAAWNLDKDGTYKSIEIKIAPEYLLRARGGSDTEGTYCWNTSGTPLLPLKLMPSEGKHRTTNLPILEQAFDAAMQSAWNINKLVRNKYLS